MMGRPSKLHRPFLTVIIGVSVLLFFSFQASSQERFQHNSSDPALTSWEVFDEGETDTPSAWSSANGVIDQSSNIYGGGAGMEPEKPGTMAISGNPAWSDLQFALHLLSRDDDALGIVFRFQDPKNYYRYAMDKQRNTIRLVKFVEGNLSILAERPFAYNKNEWYAVSVKAAGPDIQILLNHRPVITVTDATFAKGRIGLYCWGNKGASFKDIIAAPLERSAPSRAPEPAMAPPGIESAAPPPATPEGKSGYGKAPVSSMEILTREVELLKKEVRTLREEAEIRRQLQMTEDEKSEEEEELLTAAGREYTLLKKGTLGFEYNFSYSYYSLDAISAIYTVNKFSNHNLSHSLFMEYALFDNLTLNMDIPFTFKHYDEDNESKWINDLGDFRFGLQFQPVKTSADKPAVILTSNLSCPTGRSPYEINSATDLATGNGIYSLSTGLSASKTIDPIIAFGSVGYTYNFTETGLNYKYGPSEETIKEVDSGDYITASAGFAYSLSYMVSLNMSYQFSYAMDSTYRFRNEASPSQEVAGGVSSIFSIGMGFRVAKTQSVITSIAMGFTNDDPDFLISVRVPFELNLVK